MKTFRRFQSFRENFLDVKIILHSEFCATRISVLGEDITAAGAETEGGGVGVLVGGRL